jgi:hypothetical protein
MEAMKSTVGKMRQAVLSIGTAALFSAHLVGAVSATTGEAPFTLECKEVDDIGGQRSHFTVLYTIDLSRKQFSNLTAGNPQVFHVKSYDDRYIYLENSKAINSKINRFTGEINVESKVDRQTAITGVCHKTRFIPFPEKQF